VFRYSYEDSLNMPYSTAVKMLIENNYLSTPESELKKTGGIMEFASHMSK
jgi:hypothetical protein